MHNIIYETDDYYRQKLEKYIKHNKLVINNKMVHVDISKPYNTISIDCQDLIVVNNFFVKNKIKCDFGKYNDENMRTIIYNNYIDILDYIIGINFSCCGDYCPYDTIDSKLIDCFYLASKKSNINILVHILQCIDFSADYQFMGKAMLSIALNKIFSKREPEVVCRVLDNIDKKIIEFKSSILCAIESGYLQNVKLLAEKCGITDFGNVIPNSSHAPLIQALECGFIDIAEYLIEHGMDIKYININPIIYKCAMNDDMETIHFMLDKVNLNKDDINDIFVNSAQYSTEFVELLIDIGANVGEYGKHLCLKADDVQNKTLVKYLKRIMKINNVRTSQ